MFRIDGLTGEQIWPIDQPLRVSRFGAGNINDTFKLKGNAASYILQRVNPKVFHIDSLVANYDQLIPAIRAYQRAQKVKLTPSFQDTLFGKIHYKDKEGAAWRLVEFVEGAKTYATSREKGLSLQAATSIGGFQRFLNRLEPSSFLYPIHQFHALDHRRSVFQKTKTTAPAHLLNQAIPEIQALESQWSLIDELNSLFSKPYGRLAHNDAKLENILFGKQQTFVIDLDTVMPGHLAFDYGDLVRTLVCAVKEDEKDLSRISVRLDHFEALTKGYVQALKGSITVEEKESLLMGALYILLEQAIRFLTDFLAGDVYYKTTYPTQNLVRARNQFTFFRQLQQYQIQLEKIVTRYSQF